MSREHFLSPEVINEFRGRDIYQHLVKTRIRDFDHLLEFLFERFSALAQCKPLENSATEKVAAAIRIETGLSQSIIDSAFREHFLSFKYARACIASGAHYHDAVTGKPVSPVPEEHRLAIMKYSWRCR